jgi:hypothetical protein
LALKKVGGTNLIRFAWFVDLGQFRVNGLALKKVGGTNGTVRVVFSRKFSSGWKGNFLNFPHPW